MPRTTRHKISVTIIEDNRYVREGWKAVLGSSKEFELAGSYGSCEAAFRENAVFSSDVVVMDIGLPGMSGIEGTRKILKRARSTAVVMCTVFEDEDRIYEAICAGSVGYLLKKTTAEDFLKALKDAASGGSPMTPSIARKVLKRMQGTDHTASRSEEQLSDREVDVLRLLAQGKSYAAIGEALFLSIDGVRYHIRNIYQKLQTGTRSEAVAKGIGRRIIDPAR